MLMMTSWAFLRTSNEDNYEPQETSTNKAVTSSESTKGEIQLQWLWIMLVSLLVQNFLGQWYPPGLEIGMCQKSRKNIDSTFYTLSPEGWKEWYLGADSDTTSATATAKLPDENDEHDDDDVNNIIHVECGAPEWANSNASIGPIQAMMNSIIA